MPTIGTQQITTALTNEVVATVTGLTDKNRVSLVAAFTYGSSGTSASGICVTLLALSRLNAAA